MPPPPALDDAKIAEAISYARTNFGNSASPVDAEQVKKVRESLGGRNSPWTASELTALRTGAPGGAAAAHGSAAGAAPAQGTAAVANGTKKRPNQGRPRAPSPR